MTVLPSQPTTEHTPTPWRVTHDERGSTVRSADDLGRPIASMWLNGDEPAHNAAFIVEAVNSHATLTARVEELEKALREISDLYVNAPGWAAPAPSHQREYKMHQIARAVLEPKGAAV